MSLCRWSIYISGWFYNLVVFADTLWLVKRTIFDPGYWPRFDLLPINIRFFHLQKSRTVTACLLHTLKQTPVSETIPSIKVYHTVTDWLLTKCNQALDYNGSVIAKLITCFSHSKLKLLLVNWFDKNHPVTEIEQNHRKLLVLSLAICVHFLKQISSLLWYLDSMIAWHCLCFALFELLRPYEYINIT